MDPISHLKNMAAVRAARADGPRKHPGHPKDAKVAHPNRNPPPPRETPPMMDATYPKRSR